MGSLDALGKKIVFPLHLKNNFQKTICTVSEGEPRRKVKTTIFLTIMKTQINDGKEKRSIVFMSGFSYIT